MSQVFDRMLGTDMKEAASGQIHIEDVRPEVIQQMLDFVYVGKISSQEEALSDDSVIQLLYVAEKYGITKMKKEVLNHMCLKLTVDNVIRYVGAFKLYDAGELTLAQAFDFCKRYCSLLSCSIYSKR